MRRFLFYQRARAGFGLYHDCHIVSRITAARLQIIITQRKRLKLDGQAAGSFVEELAAMCHERVKIKNGGEGMTNYFASIVENSGEDKRVQQQAEMQSNSQKRAMETGQESVPTIEQMSEKPTNDENGTMLTTSEIIDFAEGTDTYL